MSLQYSSSSEERGAYFLGMGSGYVPTNRVLYLFCVCLVVTPGIIDLNSKLIAYLQIASSQ